MPLFRLKTSDFFSPSETYKMMKHDLDNIFVKFVILVKLFYFLQVLETVSPLFYEI